MIFAWILHQFIMQDPCPDSPPIYNVEILAQILHQFIMCDPSSFYLIVCLFYQMDSGWHHNIYVRVHSSTGLSCMYLWCRQCMSIESWGWTFRCSNLTLWTMFTVKLFVHIAQWCAIVRPAVHWQRVLHSRMMQLFEVLPAQQSIHKISNFRYLHSKFYLFCCFHNLYTIAK